MVWAAIRFNEVDRLVHFRGGLVAFTIFPNVKSPEYGDALNIGRFFKCKMSTLLQHDAHGNWEEEERADTNYVSQN